MHFFGLQHVQTTWKQNSLHSEDEIAKYKNNIDARSLRSFNHCNRLIALHYFAFEKA